MTEEEAVALLQEQFLGDSGLVARLKKGEEIDASSITRIHEALQTLKVAWQFTDKVPKAAIRAMVDVPEIILVCRLNYPGREAEIEELASNLYSWIYDIFAESPDHPSEDQAIAVIYNQFLGLAPLHLELHEGHGVQQPSLEDLLTALDALQLHWVNRKNIPKIAAVALLSPYGEIWNSAGLYPLDEQQRLQELANRLSQRVKRCLE